MKKQFLPILLLVWTVSVYGDVIRGTLPNGVSAIVVTSASRSNDVATSEKNRFKVVYNKTRQRLSLIKNDTLFPVILGIKVGKRVYPVAKAISENICANENAVALNTLNTEIRRATFEFGSIGSDEAFAYLKNFSRRNFSRNLGRAIKQITSAKFTTEVDNNCAPSGNALSSGLTSSGGVSSLTIAKPGDLDNDGIPDIFDIDRDGDGIINPFDPDNRGFRRDFYVFSNLKAPIEATLNSNTGSTPTDSEVDNLLSSINKLAIEVKADSDAGQTSELNCGTLGYCSTGGSGTIEDTSTAFPGALGGTYDSDSDGHGTIEEGITGDFQLKTNANASAINAGDFFVQIVNRPSSRPIRFFKRLDFVFKGTPAIKTITRNPGTAGESAYSFSYPVTDGDPGTATNCLNVAEESGNLVLQIEAWRPQRKGIPAAGEADFVDLGNSDITIDIPNTPCSAGGSGGCTGARSPNNCTVSTYSESDANLEIDGDNLRDTRADADADSSQTITFSVDLKACLAESGDTLDVGQKVFMGLQFRSEGDGDEGRDNAAIRFCVERTA